MTGGAKLLLLAMWLSGTGGAVLLSVPIHHLFWTLASVAFFASLAGLLMRPRVKLSGDLPDKMSAGQVSRSTVRIQNLGRLPAFDVGLGLFGLPSAVTLQERPPTIATLAPGASAELPIVLRAERRGQHRMPDLETFTSFAFHFYRRTGTRRRTPPLLVVPAFSPLADVDLPVGRRYQPGGVAMTSNVGESPEYIGNRDYRSGDPLRRIDFRSWARLARPVVREYQEEYFCRVALVLDTYVPAGPRPPRQGYPAMEAAVSLCAAIADALTRGEFIIDVFAAGPELYVFRAGRNISHFDNLLEILACVDPCRTSPFSRIAPSLADELQNISTVVYVMLDWDNARERFVRTAVESGCEARVLIIRDGETTKPFASVEDWGGPVTQFAPEDVLRGEVEAI
jgi:uncharacterized protein (DUF58 family)